MLEKPNMNENPTQNDQNTDFPKFSELSASEQEVWEILFLNLPDDGLYDGYLPESLASFKKDTNVAILTKFRHNLAKIYLRRRILQVMFKVTNYVEQIRSYVKRNSGISLLDNQVEYPSKIHFDAQTQFALDYIDVFGILKKENDLTRILNFIPVSKIADQVKIEFHIKKGITYNSVLHHLEKILVGMPLNVNKTIVGDDELEDIRKVQVVEFYEDEAKPKKQSKSVRLSRVGYEICSRLFRSDSPYRRLYDLQDNCEALLTEIIVRRRLVKDRLGTLQHYLEQINDQISRFEKKVLTVFEEETLRVVRQDFKEDTRPLDFPAYINKKTRENPTGGAFGTFILNYREIGRNLYKSRIELEKIEKELKRIKSVLHGIDQSLEKVENDLDYIPNPLIIQVVLYAENVSKEKSTAFDEIKKTIDKTLKSFDHEERQFYQKFAEFDRTYGGL